MQVWNIRNGLYQSSKIDDIQRFETFRFDVVIDLEGGFDPIPEKNFLYVYYHFLDLPILPNKNSLKAVVSLGFNLWRHGANVLVHCAQGMNRSSLVNGLILNLHGYPGNEAVKIIAAARPGALTNPVFRLYLESLE